MPAQKPGRSKQDYQTPACFLAAVKRRFGIQDFSIDLAASAENTVCRWYYSEADDALICPWTSSGLAWCNPPYARIEPWVEHACSEAERGARLVMLLPAAFGSNWYRDYAHDSAFTLALNGRLTFVGEPAPYIKDCMLLVYGPDVAPGFDVWDWA